MSGGWLDVPVACALLVLAIAMLAWGVCDALRSENKGTRNR